MDGKIVGTAHALDTDPTEFSKKIQTCVEGLNGGFIEVQYQPVVLPNGQVMYTALFIGREKS
jgi:hypothetical protein